MKGIKIEDLYSYKFLSGLTYSDNGKNCVFVVTETDKENNSYRSCLYLYRDGKIRQLTSMGKESSFIFNGNDELYLFTSRSDEEKKKAEALKQFTPVYRLPLDGGEAVKFMDLPLRAGEVKKINESLYLISGPFDKNHPDYYKLSEKKKSAIDAQYKADRDYETIDEIPFYFNGMGYTKNMRNGLFLFDVKKKSLERITGPLFAANSAVVLHDRIYYSGSDYEHVDTLNQGIYCYDLKKKKSFVIMKPQYTVYGLEKYQDSIIAMISRHEKHGLNENPILYRIDPKTNRLSIFNEEDRSYGNSTGSDCRYGNGRILKAEGERLYFIETRNYETVLGYFDNEGKAHDVYTPQGSIDDFDVHGDEIIMNILSAGSPQELYVLKNGKVRKISRFNTDAVKDRYVALPQHETVRSAKYDIDGWVLYPKDFDRKKKYPAILDVHGGPKTVYGEVFYHEMQVWTGKGYFVFFCNPFGSDGKGDDFSDIRGKYGTTDYQNIMDFTDHVLNRYKNIDPKRVCVTGGSYGGFMTNWIVGHTDRFKAAATQRSISSWISFYGTSDIGIDFVKDQQNAGLDDLDALWQHSPMKYVNSVKTPILFIHSDEDYRCPLEQGMQYYTSITNNGIETRMVIFHGENHELSRSGKPLHRVKRLTEITDWFDKHTVK